PKSCINTETSIFDDKQIEAFAERLNRLKKLIEGSSSFASSDMIEAVDPQYKQGFIVAEEICRLSEDSYLGQFTRPYSTSQRPESIGRQSTPLVRGLSVQEVAEGELEKIRAERDAALQEVARLKEQLEQMKLHKGRRQKSESISSSGGSPVGSPVHLLEKSALRDGLVAKPMPRPSRFVPLVSTNKIDLSQTPTRPRQNNKDVEVEFIFGTFSSLSSSGSESSSSSSRSSSRSESSSSSSESSSSSSGSSSESDTE
ncbi:MAG: hypothetical protein WCG10_04930, partial [Chlamydiota bacterium]